MKTKLLNSPPSAFGILFSFLYNILWECINLSLYYPKLNLHLLKYLKYSDNFLNLKRFCSELRTLIIV
jgi:hypothetical protein